MSASDTSHRRAFRATGVVATLVAVLLFILTSCPSNRDGAPGQLASARDDTIAAAKSSALTLDLWIQGRSTEQLTCVLLTDARDHVAQTYEVVATLDTDDPVDVDRKEMLLGAMTDVIDLLEDADAVVSGLTSHPDPESVRRWLLDGADALDRDYR